MRHQKRRRRLNRTASERKALFRSLVTALLKSQRITTTLAKAKEARRVAEKMITLGKRADLPSQRMIFALLQDRSLVKELVTDIAPRFKNRQGGYTRIIKLANTRKGDNADLVLLELTEQKVIAPPEKKKKKEKKEEPAAKPQKDAPKAEPAKHEPPKPELHKEVPKKGFFQGLKRFLRPPKTT